MSHTSSTTNVPGEYGLSTSSTYIQYTYPYTYTPYIPEKPPCFKQKCECCYWKCQCANKKKCKE